MTLSYQFHFLLTKFKINIYIVTTFLHFWWRLNPVSECNSDCYCDYAKYNPVCAEDRKTSFISACHAGCRSSNFVNGSRTFSDCSCVSKRSGNRGMEDMVVDIKGGSATAGDCQVDCLFQFYIFLVVVCILKFSGATGRASNLLVTVR